MSSEPTVRDGVLTRPLLLKLLLAGALSFAVVNLVPRTVSGGGSVPPVRMLIETATIVGVICATLMFWGLRSDLGLPATAAVYAVVFNVLVIVVKLGLAPRGFYEVNQVRNLDGTFSIDNAFGAVLAAGVVFALYLGVYLVLYRSFRARIEHMADPDPIPRFAPGRGAVVGIVVLTILLVASGGALLLVLVPLAAGLDYLDFVFSSSLSLMIGIVLACATALAAMAFNKTSERAHVLGDASVFMSFFWVGLYFLALYHVLWVVYVLVLTSIWPLKVVTPK
ncbi:MAG: hypothetical protein E6G32_02985 [Actinobacteria bacterium]|nr:MAG: hypothetical protein E6G64_05930 [Actinomycetota bacterium]TML24726.1 MAG: hypothetical protein E6G32_02985 [Actinomycetota bacterium]